MFNVYVWASRMRSFSSQILPTGVVSWSGGLVGVLNVKMLMCEEKCLLNLLSFLKNTTKMISQKDKLKQFYVILCRGIKLT